MSISRSGITQAGNRLPVIGKAVVCGGIVDLCGVTPEPEGDIATQTRQVPGRVDRPMPAAGSDKSRLPTAQVGLSNMALFEGRDAVWNDRVHPPVRAGVRVEFRKPDGLVEIMATAASAG